MSSPKTSVAFVLRMALYVVIFAFYKISMPPYQYVISMAALSLPSALFLQLEATWLAQGHHSKTHHHPAGTISRTHPEPHGADLEPHAA